MYGGSGAGKSASYVIPNAIQLLGSYVFTDPKGELYDKTAGYFKSQGYDVKVLNLVSPQNSDGYNPLHHITSEVDVDVIANTIVKGQGDGAKAADPFWDDMAEMLLKSLIYYLKSMRPPEEQSLASCSELVRAANNNGGDNLLADLINKLPMDNQARKNFKNIETLPDKTYGSVLGTLQSKLGKFDTPAIAELTSTDTIDFQDIGSKKTAVYVISSDTHAAYDFLLTIFFSQMIQQLYDYADKCGGSLPMPTYFILDEFANIGKIPDFDKKISTSRSRKISFSVILQNLDQLEAVYEKAHETIIGNCDTHLFLGSNSQKTVEYFSKALGEKTIGSDNISTNRDVQGWKTGDSASINKSARALMTADELRRMDVDLCIIFEKGLNPIKAKKYYYFKYKTAQIVDKHKLDHNEVKVERGEWRTFNPYNPYETTAEHEGSQPHSLESLDDLFADDTPSKKEPVTVPAGTSNKTESKPKSKAEDKKMQEELVDIQKELEAKFDELFGSLDED
ncbi:MAG: type IV secretory system conjugative DNA transfer family protein [Clostridia bacterium]|nr:type IV secretory system conjugative DNA transfer family protein [Clostridia bacterium]